MPPVVLLLGVMSVHYTYYHVDTCRREAPALCLAGVQLLVSHLQDSKLHFSRGRITPDVLVRMRIIQAWIISQADAEGG